MPFYNVIQNLSSWEDTSLLGDLRPLGVTTASSTVLMAPTPNIGPLLPASVKVVANAKHRCAVNSPIAWHLGLLPVITSRICLYICTPIRVVADAKHHRRSSVNAPVTWHTCLLQVITSKFSFLYIRTPLLVQLKGTMLCNLLSKSSP